MAKTTPSTLLINLGLVVLILGIITLGLNYYQTGSYLRKYPTNVHFVIRDQGDKTVPWYSKTEGDTAYQQVVDVAWDASGAAYCQASGDDVKLINLAHSTYTFTGIWNQQNKLSTQGDQYVTMASVSHPYKTSLDLIIECYKSDNSPLIEPVSYTFDKQNETFDDNSNLAPLP